MKKLYLTLVLIFFASSIFISYNKKDFHHVIKIQTPTSIFIDINNNYIFDEKEPINIDKIYFVKKFTEEQNAYIKSKLSEEECFFLNFKAIQTANNLLKNKFIKLKNNKIYVNGKEYSELLLNSGFFYDDTKASQDKLIKTIKSYNLDEYVVLNTKSKRYHNLNCKEIINSKNIKIIKRNNLEKNAIPCINCILPIQRHNNEETVVTTKINKLFEKENIKVIYTDLNEIYKPSNLCTTQACTTLKSEINNAKSTIDFAVYGINNQPEIIQALENAKKRGVKIRWVCDFDKNNGNYYKDTDKLKQIIPSYNTDKQYDLQNRPAIMHNKFFIFDDKKVFTGSANITSTDISGFNANISVLINSKKVANIYKKEFEQLYNGKFHTEKSKQNKSEININNNTKIKVLFSPQDKIITTEIIPLIQNAKEYVYIPVFFITKRELINALVSAHNNGADVKIINDATNAHGKYSIHKTLRKYGIKVKTENYAGKLHIKTIIIDDEISIIGSMNFSNNGEKYNDENVIIVQDKDIAKYLKNAFLNLWNRIPVKYENYDPKAESFESIGSCFDGIDNNFDGKIDNEDSGCYVK